MSKYKQNTAPEHKVSHYEEQWSMSDYHAHEKEFRDIMIEYQECVRIAKDSRTLARWLWLEKQGAVKLQDYNGVINPRVVMAKYPTESARFDRFREWIAFNEKNNLSPVHPDEVDSLEKMAESIANQMTI